MNMDFFHSLVCLADTPSLSVLLPTHINKYLLHFTGSPSLFSFLVLLIWLIFIISVPLSVVVLYNELNYRILWQQLLVPVGICLCVFVVDNASFEKKKPNVFKSRDLCRCSRGAFIGPIRHSTLTDCLLRWSTSCTWIAMYGEWLPWKLTAEHIASLFISITTC
jgi:hypothetical protein